MIAIGDIESFFNENFFKKVKPVERAIDHRHNADVKFNGSPEHAYEPYYNQPSYIGATKAPRPIIKDKKKLDPHNNEV